MIVHDICKECGGICCQGEISGNGRCKWLTPAGCNLCQDHRDRACNLYPFVIFEDKRFKNSRRIFLDTACPHWEKFAKLRNQVKDDDSFSLLILDEFIGYHF